MADRISPLDGLLTKGRYGRQATSETPVELVISSRMCTGLVQVNAWPKTDKKLKTTLKKITSLSLADGNLSPSNDNFTIMPIGPGRYLIEAGIDGLEQQLRDKVSVNTGAVIGLTHARVVITISGEKATWVLSKGIAIDFSLQAFPPGTSIVTTHHDIGLTIRRVDDVTFDLLVFTSLAQSFWQWLDRAASEVGYEIDVTPGTNKGMSDG